MLSFTGVCAAILIMLLFTKALTRRRRHILASLELVALLLLYFDRLTYLYGGVLSRTGYVMVRLSNFIVFFMTSAIVFVFNRYVIDLLKDEGGMKAIPTRLKVSGALAVTGMVLAVIAHYTGLYYTFDEFNHYQRAAGFAIAYIAPVVASMVQLSVIYRYRKLFGGWIYISLVLFISAPVVASFIQMMLPGISFANIVIVVAAMFLYIFAYLDINEEIEKAHRVEIEGLEHEKTSIRRLFDQTVKSFVNALDGRYVHTQGHSQRVAEYARRIAELDGKNKDECTEVYYAALLHDVGRVWIPDDLVKNLHGLSGDDLERVRKMPVIGSQILSGIEDMPGLDVGAHYHCERYDGKGYPDGLAGEEIPESARIIAAADAYDLMATETDLTPPMPHEIIRERFVAESGQQFDPKYARIILSLMDSSDMDPVRDADAVSTLWENEYYCDEYRERVTSGILVADEPVRIHMQSETYGEHEKGAPSLILFDSFDQRVHDVPAEIEAYRYTEFGEIWFDGHFVSTSARNMTAVTPDEAAGKEGGYTEQIGPGEYEITAYRQKDHLKLDIRTESGIFEFITALPDTSLYAYIGLTGEHCHVYDITIEKLDVSANEADIPRIAEPVSYIDRLESDLPNVQIDGKRTAVTKGVKIADGLRINFHTMSLPSANLIWHCPHILIYHSDDGEVSGQGYKEYGLIRLNGETRQTDERAQNVITVDREDEFGGWDKWKEDNLKGFECEINVRVIQNKITVLTSNAGISIENVTTVMDGEKDLYMAITGDQCAITDIRVR